MTFSIPINKGNYSLDTAEREEAFNRNRAFGVEKEYLRNRREWEEFPRSFHVAEYPLLVDIELSSLCNLRCPFCYTLSDEYKSKVSTQLMDFALFRKIVDEIGGKVFAIRLSLRGEPTIHPDFIQAIAYARSKGILEISTLTNGSRLTPEFFQKAMDAGIDWITLSFDGIREEYEKNRAPLKFKEMYDRLAAIREIKKNQGRVKPVIKIQSVWPAIEKDPTAYYDLMSAVCDLVAFNPIIDFAHPTPFEKIPFEENFSCPQPYQRLVIGADGLAMMCSNDEENEHVVGDMNKQSVHEVWHGPLLTRVRETHKQKDGFKSIGPCRKCYLPRKTREDVASVKGRPLIVKNYL